MNLWPKSFIFEKNQTMATKDKVSYARKWRKDRRENRRFEIFTAQYLLCKYPTIHEEIKKKFDQINAKYPKKNNLLKTPEFAVWKSDVLLGQPPSQQTTTATLSQPPSQQTTAVTLSQLPPQQTTAATSSQPPSQQTTTATTTTVLNSSEELTTLCEDMPYEDPWMANLNCDEMERIIQDLSNDPDLQGIMNTFTT